MLLQSFLSEIIDIRIIPETDSVIHSGKNKFSFF